MTKSAQPTVTVGLPTLKRNQVLIDTLKMLLAQDYPAFEVMVADQTKQHEPGFNEAIAELTKDRRLHYYRVTPASLPAARNFIIQKAKGEILLFVDDDIQIKNGFISEHIKQHSLHPEVSVIAGRISQPDLPLADEPLYFDKFGLPQYTFNCPNSRTCTNFPGGNHSLKTSAIKSIGGYSTAYKGAAIREESDAAYRLSRQGHRMYFSAEAAVIHLFKPFGGSRIAKRQFDDFGFYANDLFFALRTVKKHLLIMALYRRLRIYSGGGGSWQNRLYRIVLFKAAFWAALWRLAFARERIVAREVRNR